MPPPLVGQLEQSKPGPFREQLQGPPSTESVAPGSIRDHHKGQRQQDQDRPWQSIHSFVGLRTQVLHPSRGGSFLPSIVLRHNNIGVSLGRVKPHLDAAPAASGLCGVFVGVGPDFLTQVFRSGEDVAEGSAHGAPRTAICS